MGLGRMALRHLSAPRARAGAVSLAPPGCPRSAPIRGGQDGTTPDRWRAFGRWSVRAEVIAQAKGDWTPTRPGAVWSSMRRLLA